MTHVRAKSNTDLLMNIIMNTEIGEGLEGGEALKTVFEAARLILHDDRRPHSQHAFALRRLDEVMDDPIGPTDRQAVLDYRLETMDNCP